MRLVGGLSTVYSLDNTTNSQVYNYVQQGSAQPCLASFAISLPIYSANVSIFSSWNRLPKNWIATGAP